MNSLLFPYIHYLSAMVAASAGAVSIAPNYVGYGESVGHNRTFISKIPYEQAISLAWLGTIGTKRYIDEQSESCSFSENMATVTGKLARSVLFFHGRLVVDSTNPCFINSLVSVYHHRRLDAIGLNSIHLRAFTARAYPPLLQTNPSNFPL
jgi:hypothetical protein